MDNNSTLAENEKSRICQQLDFDDAYSSAFGIQSSALIGRFVTKTPFFHAFIERKILNRYLVAERDFDEGDLIFEENALAVGPNPETTLQCILCSKKVSFT